MAFFVSSLVFGTIAQILISFFWGGENKLSRCVCAQVQRTVTLKTRGFRPAAERNKKLSVENTWSRHIPEIKSEKRLSDAVAKDFQTSTFWKNLLGGQQSKIKENSSVVRQVFFSVYFKTFISETRPTTCSFWHYLMNWSSLWPKSLQALVVHITDRSLVKHKRLCVLSSCSLSIFVAG